MEVPRLHIREIEDMEQVPKFLRHGIVRNVSFAVEFAGVYDELAEVFVEFLGKLKNNTLLDLASGYGGPVTTMLHAVKKRGIEPPRFVLSDFNPNIERFRFLSIEDSNISYFGGRVDAMDPQKEIRKYPRTMFDAIHHFTPENAGKILKNASEHSEGIFIAESTDRALYQVPRAGIGCFLASLISPFFMQPFSVKETVFTWAIPVIPLITAHDGAVSTFKRYTREEMWNIIDSAGKNDFVWEVGELKRGVTYLVGYRNGD
jgi:hypothetical protein